MVVTSIIHSIDANYSHQWPNDFVATLLFWLRISNIIGTALPPDDRSTFSHRRSPKCVIRRALSSHTHSRF